MNDPSSGHAAIEGGCSCGGVRYAIRGPVLASGICHCRSCRTSASAPMVAWVTVRAAHFRVTAGQPQVFASSADVQRSFCPRCGSPLTYRQAGDADVDVTTVSLDDPDSFPPTHEGWLEDRLQWAAVNPTLAHFPRGTRDSLA